MKRALATLLLLCLCLVGRAPCHASQAEVTLRVSGTTGDRIAPFTLVALGGEDSTAWFDAESWLTNFPGVLTWDAEDKRLTLDGGESWAALKAAPPYAIKDGRPLEISGTYAPRIIDGKLAVSEGFLHRHAAELVGTPLRIERHEQGPGRVVIIDPAFGGYETGDTGVDGLLAKDLLLSFARTLAEHLEQKGYRAHLTRRTDEEMSADRRASIANFWGAELFLSLQVTGKARPQARGYQLFYPVAPAHCKDPTRWECAQLDFEEHSKNWAEALNAELGRSLETFNLGVSTVESPLMEAVNAPAALAVLGNLAWPQDAETFLDETRREGLCEALTEAVTRYFNESGTGR